MLVKKSKRQNLKFVYTLHHIVVSQTTLPGLEASVRITQRTVVILMCTTLEHSLFEQATMFQMLHTSLQQSFVG